MNALLSHGWLQGDMGARESARKVIITLLDAYGSMIFEHGLFHADPHPGGCHVLAIRAT
jgi:predicted unusual protein kinase regulating ubiquinone biosynthesis (AarF/ABC1/UbiB family)